MFYAKRSKRVSSILLAAAAIALACSDHTRAQGKSGKSPQEPRYKAVFAPEGADVVGLGVDLTYYDGIEGRQSLGSRTGYGGSVTLTFSGDTADQILAHTGSGPTITGEIYLVVDTLADGTQVPFLGFRWKADKKVSYYFLVGGQNVMDRYVGGVEGDLASMAHISFLNAPYELWVSRTGGGGQLLGSNSGHVTSFEVQTGPQ